MDLVSLLGACCVGLECILAERPLQIRFLATMSILLGFLEPLSGASVPFQNPLFRAIHSQKPKFFTYPRPRELSFLASRGFGAAFGRLFRCCCLYSCGVRPANPGSRRVWLARLGCLFLLKSEMHVSRSPQKPFPRQCEVLTRRPSSFACVKLRKMQVAVLLVLPPTAIPHSLGLTLSWPFSLGLVQFVLTFFPLPRSLAWL